MNILAFDLSTRRGSLALSTGNGVAFTRDWPNDRRNSGPFFQLLGEVIVEHGTPDLIVVGVGPGSYTGSRIAISTGIGLQASTGATLGGLPSVVGLSNEEDYVAIGDAKRSSFFFAHVRGGRLIGAPEVFSETEMTTRISSIGLPVYTSDDLPQFNAAQVRFPSAELLCRAATESPQNLIRAPLTPIYLREPHITTPRSKHDTAASSLLG
jgi:universal bacterial protein YeaZ